MQNAGTSCARALRIAQYALRSKVSLRKAVTPFRPPSSRHAFFSTNLTDEAHPPQDAHVESEGEDKAHASVDGSVSGGVISEYATELENILQSSPAQNQNGALSEPTPTHTPSPSSHSSARPARARVHNARGARVAEALALSMFGDSPPRDHEGTQDLRSFAVEQALPLPPEIPPDSRDVLTDEEMRMYLAPLYSRRWSVVFTNDTKGKSQRVLTKMGVFKTDDLAQSFSRRALRHVHHVHPGCCATR
ncbi:hypothetical protein DAEQUDRAFT_96183 [Daedalea quercina L-15889]|uniref:Uncharacterized protein n=1 Tax=Daedalea quercina L-15889 TaxID=1314783 RepID=A0A165SB66_9APHY|nr:hypothetical protein DAEQUDRAFT_96183 [Daedalea quercina L-15889]